MKNIFIGLWNYIPMHIGQTDKFSTMSMFIGFLDLIIY